MPHRTASPVEEVERNGESKTAAHSLLVGVTELQDMMTESSISECQLLAQGLWMIVLLLSSGLA